jgi:nitrogen fixation NifU-like protein
MPAADMYRENILEHYKHPRNKGRLDRADIESEGSNPACGDELILYVKLESGRVKEVAFDGKGCAISQASASMLTEKMGGKSLNELKKLTNDDIFDMLGVPISPVRVKCALLSLKMLEEGIKEYETRP